MFISEFIYEFIIFYIFYMYQYIRTDFHSSVAAMGLAAACKTPRHLDFGTAGFLDSATNSRLERAGKS